MTTLNAALYHAATRLRAYSPSARLDAELLLAHILGVTRSNLSANLDQQQASNHATQFEQLIDRRAAGEPIAYILGEREFYGLPLIVDRRVLVPRPETELLVERALAVAARYPADYPLRIADIGTGSGAIAIAIAAHAPTAHIIAIDLSPDALQVARANVRRHGLQDRITLQQGHGLAPLEHPVDLLLSNPPYTILAEVDANVREHEPHLALDGGADGLDLIRELIAAAPRYLHEGTLLMEIGAWQGHAVKELARASFPCAAITLHPDLAGHDRILEVDVKRFNHNYAP